MCLEALELQLTVVISGGQHGEAVGQGDKSKGLLRTTKPFMVSQPTRRGYLRGIPGEEAAVWQECSQIQAHIAILSSSSRERLVQGDGRGPAIVRGYEARGLAVLATLAVGGVNPDGLGATIPFAHQPRLDTLTTKRGLLIALQNPGVSGSTGFKSAGPRGLNVRLSFSGDTSRIREIFPGRPPCWTE